jgi:methionyl-tRNA formyltransferase
MTYTPTVVFFGSGPVAAQSLDLLAQDFTIEAVVTKPQPAHHREAFPVLSLAKKLGLKTLTPGTKQELSKLFATKPVTSRLGVVVDYGLIIPKDVIDYFPLGIINSHFSLLPRWRGADPITFAILNGDAETGVSLMLIVEKLDEGPLLAQAPFQLAPDITTPELTEELIMLSYHMLKQIIPVYEAGEAKPYPQSINIKPTYSRKLTKADGLIDWHKPAEIIERKIRAFIEWPKSRATLAGKEVIITKARVSSSTEYRVQSTELGKPFVTPQKELAVVTGKDILVVEKLKPAGKKEMTAESFMAGYKNLL